MCDLHWRHVDVASNQGTHGGHQILVWMPIGGMCLLLVSQWP
jgi:hypothetical protein